MLVFACRLSLLSLLVPVTDVSGFHDVPIFWTDASHYHLMSRYSCINYFEWNEMHGIFSMELGGSHKIY